MSGKYEIGKFYSVPCLQASKTPLNLVALTTERAYTYGRLRLQR
jgi:hypothetical protein